MKKERINAESFKLCNIDQVKVDEILDKYPSNRKASACLLYTSPSPRDRTRSRMPSSA